MTVRVTFSSHRRFIIIIKYTTGCVFLKYEHLPDELNHVEGIARDNEDTWQASWWSHKDLVNAHKNCSSC